MSPIEALTGMRTRLGRTSFAPDPGAGTPERFFACLPARLRRALARRDRRLVVTPLGAAAGVELVTGETREDLGGLDLASRDVPTGMPEAARDPRRQTLLMLPASAVLTRRATIPAPFRDQPAKFLGYELDRLSPFKPEQVIFDARVIGGGKDKALLSLELALTRRDAVEPWLKRLREAGAPADQITWEGAWPRANLLPASERPRRRQPLLDPDKLLLGLIVVLLGAVLITPIWQGHRDLQTLEGEVRKARAQAIQVDEVRQALERARRGSTEVLRQKSERPRMLELLRELTERIPEDTWVQSLEYQNGEVQLRGESGRATALIGLLEGAPGISGVQFRSPVTQVAQTGKERFNLAFTYKRSEPPTP